MLRITRLSGCKQYNSLGKLDREQLQPSGELAACLMELPFGQLECGDTAITTPKEAGGIYLIYFMTTT